MLTLLRWLAGFALSLLLILAAAAVIIPRVVDPNDFRDDIAQLVKDKTGRELTLQGDLQVSVFPWLGIKTQGLSLAQPSRIGGDMIDVATAQLRVKLMPLFSRRVEVDTVVLESPQIRLVTLADGFDSFSGLTSQEATTDEAGQTNVDDSDPAVAAVALVIQGLELTNGEIIIEDRELGSVTELVDLNVVTGNLLGLELADISVSGTLKDAAGGSDTIFDLAALARIDTDTLALEAQEISSKVMIGEQIMLVSLASFNFEQTQKVLIQDFNAQILGLVNSSEAIQVKAKTVHANLASQLIKIPEVKASFGDLEATINTLMIKDFAEDLSVSADVIIPQFDASTLVGQIDAELVPADPQALTRVSAEFSFVAGTDSAEVAGLNLNLDDTNLRGFATATNFSAPSFKFDLEMDQINLDRYLPQTPAPDLNRESPSTTQALLVPMALFKDVNANGRFRATQMTSGGLKLDNIDVLVASTPGNVTITPQADLYQGTLGGDVAFSQVGERSELKVRNEIDLVALGELLHATEVTDQLSGVGSLVLDLVVAEQGGVQSNSGTIKVLAKNGVIQGLDIKNIVDQGYARYQQLKGREPAPSGGESDVSDETKFAELLGTFHLNNSVLRNDDFSLKAPLFRVGGAGTIDLESETLDYTVQFSVVSSTDGQGGDAFEKLKGITIPIKLSGPITAPNYSLDMKALYKGLVKNEVDLKKAELLEEKYGITDGESLSTKDIFKQILIQKATKSDNDAGGRERPIEDVGAGSSDSDSVSSEIIEDVTANPDSPAQPEKSSKDQLKDDLKKKLLEGLFN